MYNNPRDVLIRFTSLSEEAEDRWWRPFQGVLVPAGEGARSMFEGQENRKIYWLCRYVDVQ